MSEYIFVTNIFEYSNIRIYSSHSGLKTLILAVMVLDQLTLEWAGTQNFKSIAISNMCFEKSGTSVSKWAMGKSSNFNIVRMKILWIFFRCGHGKQLKTAFFHKTLIPRNLLTEKISRIEPCERERPDDSKNVELIGRVSFWTGVIAAQSQKTVKFWLR